jgi:ribosome recycling factor
MINYDFTFFNGKITAAHEWLAREYRNIRTGRASPSILDGVMVSAYGAMTPLKQVANVSTEDARTLRVVPWDSSLVKDVEKAITAANLGVGTGSDSAGIRVSFPELSGERRAEMIKLAKHKLEESRASIRVARDEVWKDIQEKERASELTEDDKFSLKDELQKIVDKGNDELESAFEHKEKEMMN